MPEPALNLLDEVVRELSAKGPIRIGQLTEAVCESTGVTEDEVREAVWRLIDRGAVEVDSSRRLAVGTVLPQELPNICHR